MMFGHIETNSERIEHLERLRQLQDETGGFTAFICWTMQPGHKMADYAASAPLNICGRRPSPGSISITFGTFNHPG